MSEWLRTWGTLIVAAIALAQPWLISLWRKFFRSQSVEVYETGNMEIGFSPFGPTIGLQGTVRALNRDVFIRSVDLKITREKDKAEHHFRWGFFRSPWYTKPDDLHYEMCSGFLLTEQNPLRLNVLFWEPVTAAEVRPKVEGVRQTWGQMVRESPVQAFFEQHVPGQPFPDDLHKFFQSLYSEFSKKPIHMDAYEKLNRVFYWEAGAYSCELEISTSRPDRSYRSAWRFELSEEDYELLRSNVIKVLMETCGQPIGLYNVVYTRYLLAAEE